MLKRGRHALIRKAQTGDQNERRFLKDMIKEHMNSGRPNCMNVVNNAGATRFGTVVGMGLTDLFPHV